MLFAPKEKGQGLVEYAIILIFVAVIVIVIIGFWAPIVKVVISLPGEATWLQGFNMAIRYRSLLRRW